MKSVSDKTSTIKEWIARGVIILVIALVIMLIPVRYQLKDGGSVVYKAVLYEVTDWHAMTSAVDGEYKIGITVKILGLKVFDNTLFAEEE